MLTAAAIAIFAAAYLFLTTAIAHNAAEVAHRRNRQASFPGLFACCLIPALFWPLFAITNRLP